MRRNPIWFLIVLLLFVSLACGSSAALTPVPNQTNSPAKQQNESGSQNSNQNSIKTGKNNSSATSVPNSGSSSPTTTPAKSSIAKVNERAESSGIAITVLKVQKVTKAGLIAAEAGKILVDVEVLIENSGRDSAPYNPLYFKVKDVDQYEYNSSFTALEPSLQSGDLKKGEKARGHVAFEVPEKATGLVISYEPLVLFGGYEPIKINLDEVAVQNDAGSKSTPSTAIEIDGKVGDRVESAGMAVSIIKVSKVKKAGFSTAAAGKIIVDIEVIIQNAGRNETMPYNPLYFKLKDSDGYEYNTNLSSLEPSLQSGDLSKGDITRGHVAFEAPEKAAGLTISYEPQVLFGGYETIRINLEEKASKPAPVPTPLPVDAVPVGTSVESAGISLTIEKVQTMPSVGGMPVKSGNIIVDVDLIIQNTSRDEKTPYNPLYFKVKDSTGFEYAVSMLSVEPSLKAGELSKGEQARGHVSFEIPKIAKGLVISYEPQVLFGGYETIRIGLDIK